MSEVTGLHRAEAVERILEEEEEHASRFFLSFGLWFHFCFYLFTKICLNL